MLRSGAGPPGELRRLGIEPVLELPGVGANLQNHPVVYLATHLRPHARQPVWLRPHFLTALRFSSGMDPALRTRLIVQPPNPPPVIREPYTPAIPHAISTSKSSSVQLTS